MSWIYDLSLQCLFSLLIIITPSEFSRSYKSQFGHIQRESYQRTRPDVAEKYRPQICQKKQQQKWRITNENVQYFRTIGRFNV